MGAGNAVNIGSVCRCMYDPTPIIPAVNMVFDITCFCSMIFESFIPSKHPRDRAAGRSGVPAAPDRNSSVQAEAGDL